LITRVYRDETWQIAVVATDAQIWMQIECVLARIPVAEAWYPRKKMTA